jgi:glycosyltransferase involved in cell wall biosynthesis
MDSERGTPATSVASPPLDLAWWATEKSLLQTRGPEIKRFRRLHRLAHPTILFVGPYDRTGGLHLALEAVYDIRERVENTRLAAIPLGPTDPEYLDTCEGRALALGHHGIVEWTVEASDVPFWYATSTVVCAPWLEAGPDDPAILAACAGRPFVASSLPSLSEAAFSDAAVLVPVGELAALTAALERFVSDTEEAARLGAIAREQAEARFGAQTPESAA